MNNNMYKRTAVSILTLGVLLTAIIFGCGKPPERGTGEAIKKVVEEEDVIKGEGYFVAVAVEDPTHSSGGTIAYSKDGVAWEVIPLMDKDDNEMSLGAVCYGDGKFVAVPFGKNNQVGYSSNGVDWKWIDDMQDKPDVSKSVYWRGVCYGDAGFVAVGYFQDIYTGGLIAHSSDGVKWEVNGDYDQNSSSWTSVCYGNGKYVAVSSQDFTSSEDGKTWEDAQKIGSKNYYHVVFYGNEKFIAITEDGGNIAEFDVARSIWTETSYKSEVDYCHNFASGCFGNGKFIVLADVTSGNAPERTMVYSIDGTTWVVNKSMGYSSDSPLHWTSSCYGDGRFVAVSQAMNNNVEKVLTAYSDDGINWTASEPIKKNAAGKFVTSWKSVCYGRMDTTVLQQRIEYIEQNKDRLFASSKTKSDGSLLASIVKWIEELFS